MTDSITGRAKGGKASAAKLTPEQRKTKAQKAIAARWEKAKLPTATHDSGDHPLRIGDAELPCYVLEDGTRVLSQRGLQIGIGMSPGGGSSGEQRLANFALSIAEKSKEISDLSTRSSQLAERLKNPIRFNPKSGGNPANGYEATVLADLCDLVLAARAEGLLQKQQAHIAAQAEILVRGFARVGIIALVDEATGYEKTRAKDALAQILEQFIAKELQPYVKTFNPDFYAELFRLRGLKYPPDTPNFRPQYFGTLTNDIVYERLAPGMLEELKRQAAKDVKKSHLHRRLTQEVGHPKLREHLASVIAIMKLSDDYKAFIANLNRLHPRYSDSYTLDLEQPDR